MLVERFGGLLWSIARSYRLSDHDAADVVQTTWLRLLDNVDRIENPERLGSWLATTTRHECLHTLRRSRREPPLDVIDLLVPVADIRAQVDVDLLRRERDTSLWALVERMSDNCRRLIRVLIATPQPSYAEIAEALDIPIGSIGPTRQRCLANLRSLAIDADVLLDLG